MNPTLDHDDLLDRVRAADPARGADAEPPAFSALLERLDGVGTPAARPEANLDPRRRLVPRRLAVLTVAAAIIAISAVALPFGDRTHLDVVAEARAALNPGGGILHVTVEFVTTSERPMRVLGPQGKVIETNRTSYRTERWSAPAPYRYHQVAGNPGGTVYESDYSDHRFRTLAADGIVRSHVASARMTTLVLATDIGLGFPMPFSGASRAPDGPTDPIAQIRSLLQRGKVRVAGQLRFHGRDVLRLVASAPRPAPESANPIQPLKDPEYLVDASTYAPVRVTVFGGYVPSPGAPMQRTTYVTNFLTYEELPSTPENARHLEIDTTGKAIVDDPTMFTGTKKALPRKRSTR